MKKSFFGTICFLLFVATIFGQGKTSIIDKTGIELKLFNARQAYLRGDFAEALRTYKECNTAKPNDAAIMFRIGQCYLSLNDIEQAISYLEKSEAADPNAGDDLHLNLGQAYQQADEVDKALKELQMFRQKYADDPKKLKESEVDYYIAQCNTANDLKAHPIKVTITNMGIAINSEYDDKGPLLANDGKTMVFTSRRPSMSTKSKKSKDGDEDVVPQSFDNIYFSDWDSNANKWGLSYMLPGDVNEPYAYNSATGISADGVLLFLYKNNNTDATGGDIFVAKKSHSGSWANPQTMGHPINTSYYEDGASPSPDGSSLYFMSEKPGGYGQADIYKSDKLGKGEWSDPVNLGASINTPYDDGAPYLGPDGKTLFFSSQGHNSMGGYDIFKAVINDSGKWGKAVNLGYPINTVSNDMSFTITVDAKTGYFSSDRKGGQGGRDIYMVDLSQYPLLASDSGSTKPKGVSVLRGKVTNTKGKAIEGAHITITDSTGTKVGNLQTDADGKYYITLKGNANYKIKAAANNYKPVTMNIHLPESALGTYSMQQDFELQKN